MRLVSASGPDTTRKKVGGQSLSGAPSHPWVGVAVGLVFAAVGGVGLAFGLDFIHVQDANFAAQRHIVAMFAALFLMAGLTAVVRGLVGAAKVSRLKAQLAMHPDEPWLADYPWNPRGCKDDRKRKIVQTFGFVAAWFVFLTPFHYVAHTAEPSMLKFLLVFDAIGVVILGCGFYFLFQQRKFGVSWLAFERFPFHPGETLDVTFANDRIGIFDALRVTLRFVEVIVETHGTGRNRRRNVHHYQLYAATLQADEPGEISLATGAIPVSFQLPDLGYETRISGAPPQRYWELEVHAKMPGVDYHARFPLPVYAKVDPRAGR